MMVLEAGLTAESLSPDATKAQFEALSNLSRDRVHGDVPRAPEAAGHQFR
jgi:hypothetical protein